MSQDDPKPTGNPEDEASEKAPRRRFLKGGAMAAVGALAAGVVPRAAAEGVFEPGGTTKVADPNDTLANMIVNAWTSPGYWNDLRTRPASIFAGAGFPPANYKVLTESEYRNGYTKLSQTEVIYVLPDLPPGVPVTFALARQEMCGTPFGM